MAHVLCPHCQSALFIGNERTDSFVCPDCDGEFVLEHEKDEFESLERELAELNLGTEQTTGTSQKNGREQPFVKTRHDVCFFDERADKISYGQIILICIVSFVFLITFLFGAGMGKLTEGIATGVCSGLLFGVFFSLPLLGSGLSDHEYWFINRKTNVLTFTTTNEHGTPMVKEQKSYSDQLAVNAKNGFIVFYDKNWRITREINGVLKSKRQFSSRLGITVNRVDGLEFGMNNWNLALVNSDPIIVRKYATSCKGRINENKLHLLREKNTDPHFLVILFSSLLFAFIPLIFRLIMRKVVTARQANKPLFWSSRERTYLDKRRTTFLFMKQFTRGWIPTRLFKITHTSIKTRTVSHEDGSSTVFDLYLNKYDHLTFLSMERAKAMLNDIRRELPSLPQR